MTLKNTFCTAVAKGKKNFTAIAIIGHRRGETEMDFCAPCGICRQFMRELVNDDFWVVLSNGEKNAEYKMTEILPLAFDKSLI